jgi:hypothetical protein
VAPVVAVVVVDRQVIVDVVETMVVAELCAIIYIVTEVQDQVPKGLFVLFGREVFVNSQVLV